MLIANDRLRSCMMKSCIHRGIGGMLPTSWHVYYGCTDALLASISLITLYLLLKLFLCDNIWIIKDTDLYDDITIWNDKIPDTIGKR